MKKLILFSLFPLLALTVACKSNDKKTAGSDWDNPLNAANYLSDSAHFTTVLWLDSTFRDVGKIKKGEIMEITFRFKNTGNHPLIITDVVAGCGCTIPEKPREPYAPGKEGVIRAKFDSKSQQPGSHEKYVTVTANTSPETLHSLTFKTEVIE